MSSTYYTSMANSLTAEDQRRIIEELSVDGTLEGIDLALLQQKIAENPNDEDYAYLYTYLTGSVSSYWDAELVDPDMIDDLEEWANLTTSTDLAADLQEFISLIGMDPELEAALSTSGEGAAGLSTALGGSSAFTGMEEAVSYANEYYTAQQAANVTTAKDYEGLINLAFASGSTALALMYIFSGYTDPVTGEKIEGITDTIADSQKVIVENLEELHDERRDLMDEREMLDANEDGPRLSNIASEESILGQSENIEMQSLTALSTTGNDFINAITKIAEMETATRQRIWS